MTGVEHHAGGAGVVQTRLVPADLALLTQQPELAGRGAHRSGRGAEHWGSEFIGGKGHESGFVTHQASFSTKSLSVFI